MVVWHTDRLSRKARSLLWAIEELEEYGVRVESVTDPIGEGLEGDVMLTFRGHAANSEWERSAARSKANVRARVDSGKLISGSRPRYGFAWSDPSHKAKGSYVEHPDQAVWVRFAYEQLAAGLPLRALVRELERRGVKSPTGRPRWTAYTLANLARSPFYKGVAIAYAVKTTTRKGGGRDRECRPESEWVVLPEGTAPALVSPELWQAANDRLDRAAEHRRHHYPVETDPGDVLTRNRVRCAHCGCRMHVKRTGGVPYLNCQTRQRSPANGGDKDRCPGCRIVAHEVDRAAWERALWVLSDPGLVLSEYRRQQNTPPAVENTADLARAITRAGTDEANLAEALAKVSGAAQATVIARLQAASELREGLERRRAEVVALREAVERETAAVRHWLDALLSANQDLQTMGYAERREQLDRLGLEVVVAKKGSDLPRVEIHLSLPFDPAILRRDEEPVWMTPEEEAIHDDLAARFAATTLPERLAQSGNSHRSRGAGSSRGGPSAPAPCGGTAGGSPRRSRRGRRGRSRW